MFDKLSESDEVSPEDVKAKEDLYDKTRSQGGQWWRLKNACDLWTEAFFAELKLPDYRGKEMVPTTETVWEYWRHPNGIYAPLLARANQTGSEHPFFHWPLEFADVFASGGFDVVLGNPPWERINLREKEFFASRAPEVAQASNKAARERMIRELPGKKPELAKQFADATRDAECQSKFVRESGRFPLCGRGDVNTYSIFAELDRNLANDRGGTGIIVPSGIATDDTTKFFFRDLIESRSLASLYDFENREGIFPGVHRSFKFCLITMAGRRRPVKGGADMVFFALRMDHLREEERRIKLSSEDIALLNPNTHTCPIFRDRRSAEITKQIYRSVPVLANHESPDPDAWKLTLSRMFHMSDACVGVSDANAA